MAAICHAAPIESSNTRNSSRNCKETFAVAMNLENNVYIRRFSYNSIAELNCFRFSSKSIYFPPEGPLITYPDCPSPGMQCKTL